MTTRAALTSGELAALRGSGTHSVTSYLSIVPPVIVGKAQINQTTFTRPLAQLAIDNATANWATTVKAGMTVWIGTAADSASVGSNASNPAARDVGVYRVRFDASTDTTLLIAELSHGDAGATTLDTLQAFSDNLYVTIINDRALWSVFPRIVYNPPSDGVFYKDNNISYVDQNQTTVPAIVNLGEHVAGFTDGSTLEVDFTATVNTFIGTVSTYAWDVDDGTITVGTSASQSITATFPAGHRVVSCTVTLSSGAVMTAYRHVFAHDDTYPPTEVVLQSGGNYDGDGRSVQFRLLESSSAVRLQYGAMGILWDVTSWGGTDIPTADTVMPGWITSPSESITTQRTVYTVTFESPWRVAKRLRAFGQHLKIATTPAHWQECVASLAHLNFMVFYLLYYHFTPLLQLFDLEVPDYLENYIHAGWIANPGNPAAQTAQVGERLNAQVTQLANGTLVLERDLFMMTSTQKSGVVERMTLTEDDYSAVTFKYRHRPVTGQVIADGFLYNSTTGLPTPKRAASPGRVSGQAGGLQNLPNQLVATTAELGERAALTFAIENNPIESIEVELPRNYAVLAPNVEWVRLQVPASQMFNGVAYEARCKVTSLRLTVGANGIRKTVATLIPEATAPAGIVEELPVDVGNGFNVEDLDIPDYDLDGNLILPWEAMDFVPPVYGDSSTIILSPPVFIGKVALAWADDGLGLTLNRTAPGWDATATLTGNIADIAIDPFSERLTTKRGKGDFITYALTDERLYRNDNTLADPALFNEINSLTGYKLLRTPLQSQDRVIAYGVDTNEGGTTYPSGSWIIENYYGDGGGNTPPIGDYTFTELALGSYDIDDVRSNRDQLYDADSPARYTTRFNSAYYSRHNIYFVSDDTPTGNSAVKWFLKLITFDTSITIDQIAYGLLGTHTSGSSYSIRYSFRRSGVWDDALSGANSGTWGTLADSLVIPSYVEDIIALGGSETIDGIAIKFGDYFTNSGGFNVNYIAARLVGDQTLGGGGSNGTNISSSGDAGSNFDIANVGAVSTHGGMDCDDYDLGRIVASAGGSVYVSDAYTTPTMSIVSDMTLSSGEVVAIRISNRTLDTNLDRNNDDTALHLLYASSVANSGETLWKAVVNCSTQTATLTDWTPTVSAVTYIVQGANAIESWINGKVLALGKPTGGGNTALLLRDTDGTWTVQQSDIDCVYVKFVGATSAWVAGADGIYFTPDLGETLQDRTGDFSDYVGTVANLIGGFGVA